MFGHKNTQKTYCIFAIEIKNCEENNSKNFSWFIFFPFNGEQPSNSG